MSTKEKKRVQVQIEKQVAEEVEKIFEELGLNPTTAVNAFYKQVQAHGGLPFELKLTRDQVADMKLKQASGQSPLVKLETDEDIAAFFAEEDSDNG